MSQKTPTQKLANLLFLPILILMQFHIQKILQKFYTTHQYHFHSITPTSQKSSTIYKVIQRVIYSIDWFNVYLEPPPLKTLLIFNLGLRYKLNMNSISEHNFGFLKGRFSSNSKILRENIISS